MDFSVLLSIHSFIRWIVLVGFIVVLYKSYNGYKKDYIISSLDHKLRYILPVICWIQLTFGFILYNKSAMVKYFFNHLPESLNEREIRFFGIEHSTVMPLAIIILSIGAWKSYKLKQDHNKAYKNWFRWTLISFILIITSIPWSFWPLVSRPLFRGF